MHTSVWIILFNVAVVFAVLGGVATLRYELRENALCVTMFGLTMRRIPYDNIESVRRGAVWWNEHWNRISLDPCITLRLKRAAFRNFVINPPRTNEFIAQLQARLR